MSEYTPSLIRPRDGWVVVLNDKRKTLLSSGLILPDEQLGVEKVTEGSGTIVRIGIGDKSKALGLEPGQRVVYRDYLKHANPVPTEERWDDGSRKEYFIMSIDDLTMIVDPAVEIGFFSEKRA